MQERIQANQQLGQVGSNIYGQDTAIAQQNAQLQQQAALQNAQLGTQVSQGNAQLGTQAALQNAQMGNQVGLANQAATNQFALQGGQMAQQVNLQNAANQLQQQGLNNQQIQAYLNSANQRDIAELGSSNQFQGLLQNRYSQQSAGYQKLFGGLTGAASSASGVGAIGALGAGG